MDLTELKKLDKKELKKLKATIEFLLKDNITDDVKKDSEYLFDRLRFVINNVLKYEVVPEYHIFKKKNANIYQELLNVTEYLNDLLSKWYPESTLKEKIQFYNIFAKLIALHIETETDVPLALATVLRFHTFFPSLFDNAFPGAIHNETFEYILKWKLSVAIKNV